MVTEKLDKVIAGLECCGEDAAPGNCSSCPYDRSLGCACAGDLIKDALEVIRELQTKYATAVEMAATATELAAKYRRTDGDLISRAALIEEIRRIGGHNLCEWETIGVLALAERIPAVAAEPVVHAHWIERAGGTHKICSNCHTGVPAVVSVKGWLRCCVCGAHMDEEVADG